MVSPQLRARLTALSQRTGTPISSLVVSFAVMHELTAIIPLAAFFYAARWHGLGEAVVHRLERGTESSDNGYEAWVVSRCRKWTREGEEWARRIGTRYRIWGFEDGSMQAFGLRRETAGALVGDVANAVFAYGATKAILPLRIGACFYFSPGFSRRVVDPLRRLSVGLFRRWKRP